VLRPRLEVDSAIPCKARWRVSVGTAGVLGMSRVRMDVAPTTAYLLLGTRCARNCAFCAQARESHATDAALSRVHWPLYPSTDVIEHVARAYSEHRIARACFQVTVSRGYVDLTLDSVSRLHESTSVPICISIVPRSMADIDALLSAGAERVTIALDAASGHQYARAKGGNWDGALNLLASAAERFPGQISTHLIVGLGETEQEMATRMAWCLTRGIRIGLFSFTPVRGTRLESVSAPPLATYRRMQVALWLLSRGLTSLGIMRFGRLGEIVSYGLQTQLLVQLLAGGDAFRTLGCPDCNRPYYNERPGGVIYNYPRPLTFAEAAREVDALVATLDAGLEEPVPRALLATMDDATIPEGDAPTGSASGAAFRKELYDAQDGPL